MQRNIVKAMVSRTGCPATARFVPLEIFELWKSHMSSAYGYDVADEQTGHWSPSRERATADDAVDGGDAVVEVIVTKLVSGIPTQVERFFLGSELTDILPKFLSHYGIDPDRPEQMSSVRIIQGVLSPPPGNRMPGDGSRAVPKGAS